ncbi:MAG TPA: PaaI family thioesterase [Caulobacteraceae bacterium]
MTGDAPKTAQHMAHGVPHAIALGFQFVSADNGVAIMKMPWREDLVGDPETGVIAGGAVTSLLDHVGGMAIGSAFAAASRDGATTSMATLDLRIDYMRPAHPRRDIVARAHCYKLTHTIAFVRASAFEDSADDPVATVQAAFALTGGGAR